jgi:hypothetical protein
MTLSPTKSPSTSRLNHLNIHMSSQRREASTLTAGSKTWSVENASYIKKLNPSESMVVTTGLPVSLFSPPYAFETHSCPSPPPLLVFPLVYHDISEEIPEASRPLITRLYLLWLILAGTLTINMVACIFVLTSGGPDGVKDLIVSIMCVPASTSASCLMVHSRSFAL